MTDQPTNCITLHESRHEFGEEVIRIDKEGFHYRGQFIADAGEAHRLMVEFLKRSNSTPAPNSSQIGRSLVERIHSCIVGEPECGHMQARATIREVAAWMKRGHMLNAAEILEQEAKR
jgi:hypothetical protein